MRCVGAVDPRLREELVAGFRWIRANYSFPTSVEIRFVHVARIVDFDGAACALRWWSEDGGSFVGEIAVLSFAKNYAREGPTVAFPTVVAAVGRALKYYFQCVSGAPNRADHAEAWSERFLEAYIDDDVPPPPPFSRRSKPATTARRRGASRPR